MVGHKLGEFCPTRQFSGHTPADKKAAQEAEVAKTSTAPRSSSTTGSAPSAKSKEVKNEKK